MTKGIKTVMVFHWVLSRLQATEKKHAGDHVGGGRETYYIISLHSCSICYLLVSRGHPGDLGDKHSFEVSLKPLLQTPTKPDKVMERRDTTKYLW